MTNRERLERIIKAVRGPILWKRFVAVDNIRDEIGFLLRALDYAANEGSWGACPEESGPGLTDWYDEEDCQ